jgi:hypothetical protein
MVLDNIFISPLDWYKETKEPKSQAGEGGGLSIFIDSHSNTLREMSVDTDFNGFTVLLSPPSEFPLTNQGSMF